MHVHAKDKGTKEQEILIEAGSGLGKLAIEKMENEMQATYNPAIKNNSSSNVTDADLGAVK